MRSRSSLTTCTSFSRRPLTVAAKSSSARWRSSQSVEKSTLGLQLPCFSMSVSASGPVAGVDALAPVSRNSVNLRNEISKLSESIAESHIKQSASVFDSSSTSKPTASSLSWRSESWLMSIQPKMLLATIDSQRRPICRKVRSAVRCSSASSVGLCRTVQRGVCSSSGFSRRRPSSICRRKCSRLLRSVWLKTRSSSSVAGSEKCVCWSMKRSTSQARRSWRSA